MTHFTITLQTRGLTADTPEQAIKLGESIADVANQSRLKSYGVQVEVTDVRDDDAEPEVEAPADEKKDNGRSWRK